MNSDFFRHSGHLFCHGMIKGKEIELKEMQKLHLENGEGSSAWQKDHFVLKVEFMVLMLIERITEWPTKIMHNRFTRQNFDLKNILD